MPHDHRPDGRSILFSSLLSVALALAVLAIVTVLTGPAGAPVYEIASALTIAAVVHLLAVFLLQLRPKMPDA